MGKRLLSKVLAISVITAGLTITSELSFASNISTIGTVNKANKVQQELLEEAKNSLKGVIYPEKIIKLKQLTADTYLTIMEVNTPMGKRNIPVVVIKNKGIIIGEYFENGNNLSASFIRTIHLNTVKKEFPKLKKEIKESIMAKYTPKGKAIRGQLYVFVDPLCPFCRNAEKRFVKWANKYGYEIYLIPFIVHGERAKDLTQSFICNNKTFNDYIEGNYGKPNRIGCKASENIIKYSVSVERNLQLRGTPTFVTGKGNEVEGINYPAVEKLMSEGK